MVETIVLGLLTLVTFIIKAVLNAQTNKAVDERLKAMEAEFERKRIEQEAKDKADAEAVVTTDDDATDAADFLRDSFK